MKIIGIGLLFCATAQAQVFYCPPQHPRTILATAGDTNTFVAPSLLSGGGVYWGELGAQTEMHGDRKRFKGGVDVIYGLPDNQKRWLVCQYAGSSITLWTAVDNAASTCKLHQRDHGGNVSVQAECK